MEITTAREILKRAKKDEMYEGPVPEDDATAIKEAEGLVEMAEAAWAQMVRGPEVEAILKLAAAAENGDQPAEPEEAPKSQETAPAPPREAPKTEPSGLNPPSKLTAGEEGLTKREPWEGYGDWTVKDITNGLDWYLENEAGTFLDLCQHVWQFETSHKNRSRILESLVELWKRAGGELDEAQEDRRPDEPESAQSESAETEEGPEAGESDSEGDGDSDGEELPSSEEPEESESDARDDAEPEARPEADERSDDEGKPEAESQADGPRGAYRKLIEIVERELAAERLDGIPKPPGEPAPELPWNWNDVPDSTLHNLHMQYASFAYYKAFVQSRDERIAMHCKEAADELHAALMVKVPKYDEKNKEKKVGLIEAEIAQDPNVKRWRKMQHKHEQMAAQARAEKDSYLKLVEAMSRLETMRHNVWERGRR